MIGFAEGDGHFSITNQVDKAGYVVFKITQSTTDTQVLFMIKESLGFGSVSILSKLNKTHQYRIKDKDNLIKIINIFNGNLITKAKIIQFKSFLEAFNHKYKTNIIFIECNNKVTLTNSWLSGFTLLIFIFFNYLIIYLILRFFNRVLNYLLGFKEKESWSRPREVLGLHKEKETKIVYSFYLFIFTKSPQLFKFNNLVLKLFS